MFLNLCCVCYNFDSDLIVGSEFLKLGPTTMMSLAMLGWGIDKACLTPNNEVPVGKIAEEGDDFSKKGKSAKEVTEFLMIIQQSEFKVIEQLNKTPVRISLLGLLMNSEPHQGYHHLFPQLRNCKVFHTK